MNVGVVLGSIIAQFFPYRVVYLFSSSLALVLIGIAVFSVHSRRIKYIYNTGNTGAQQKKEGGSLAAFLVKPAALAAFFFFIIPYVASLSFTSYFMPVYGIENGLRESNIGQLILLNKLFAILFGASLCELVSKKYL